MAVEPISERIAVEDSIEAIAALWERSGVPTAVVCTEPFRRSALETAVVQGMPDYPFIRVAHPINAATREELLACAGAVLPDVVGLPLMTKE